MMDGPKDMYRLRFGENAFYRLFENMVGPWEPQGLVGTTGDTELISDQQPLTRLVFEKDGRVSAIRADGTVEERYHRWWPAGAWITIQWYRYAPEEGAQATSSDHPGLFARARRRPHGGRGNERGWVGRE